MSTARLHFASLLLLSVALSCSTETAPTDPVEPAPTSGMLEIAIEESGGRPDTDGYDLAITLATQAGPVVRAVPAGGGSIVLPDLPLGTHVLRVQGLAPHCSVMGGHPRGFTIRAGETVRLTVGIFCPGPGAILVLTTTRGRDAPTGEFSLSIRGDAAIERSIGTNDSLRFEEDDLPEGEPWFLELTGVPENCRLDLPLTTARNLNGATLRVEYEITCIPRGSKIAFEVFGQIYLTGGGDEVNLGVTWSASRTGPSLSPDRSRVVFSSNPEGIDFLLALVNADGSGSSWLTSYDGGSFVGSQAWSPDGSRIVFWKQNGSSSDIYVMDVDGSGGVRLTFAGWNTHPAWSPDGSSIAFCRITGNVEEDYPDVYRMSAVDGGGLTKVADSGCDPAWSPDGAKIAFTDYAVMRPPDLAVVGADGSGYTQLHPGARAPEQTSQSPSWSPDGSQIAYSGGRTGDRIWIVEFGGSAFGEAFPYRLGSAPSWR